MNHRLRGVSRFAIMLALASPAAAIAGTITGTVSDGTGTRALQSTQLRIVETGHIAEAGRDGSYRFPDMAPGTYTIEARYTGADPVRTTVVVPASGDVDADIRIGSDIDSSIIVVGQLANQASALSRQRAADGVESVLTRDAIGQFPDQNVAESLRRLPGVNILNDQGEGRFVSVRGLDPELNAASVNGARLPAPESDFRSVALDVVPSELIESIEVKKSLTPDMDADTIGASIEINTTSAFDRKKDLYSAKVEGSYNDYANTVTPKGSVDFSTRLTDRFGISGGLSYYKRRFETDNIEASDWTSSDDGIDYAETLEYRDYDVARKRIGATLNMDWMPSDTTKLYARGIYNQFDDHEYRRRLTFVLDEQPASGGADSANFTDEDGRIEVRRDLKDRFERQRIKSLVLGGTTETGPWKLIYSGSWSESSEKEAGSIDPIRWRARFDGDGVDVNFNYADPRIPTFDVTSGADLFNDPSEYAFNRVEQTILSDSRDREYAIKGDIARAFATDSGTFTVQAGMKARWRKKSYDFNMNYYDKSNLDLADVLGDQTYRLANIGPVPAKGAASDYFYANQSAFRLDPVASEYESAAADYDAKEDVLATYLMGRWDSETLRLIGGVRMEQTRNVLRGNLVDTDGDENSITPNIFTKHYTDWLPSLTARLEPSQGLVFRAAGYKSLVRPKLSQLAPRFLRDEDGAAEFGNPDLKPFRAWNLDASAEWYFSRNGALTAGLFWKSIKNYTAQIRDFDNGSYNGVAYSEASYFVNGDTAKVKGVELSFSQVLNFLPSPLDGLLVNLNYSYTDAKAKITSYDGDDNAYLRTIGLPNASKHTANAVLGYEKGPLSLRAAGTYRSKYLDEVGDAPDTDRIVDNHFQLDLSAKYKVLPGVRLFADWVNVNNAKYFAYQNFNGNKRLLQFEEYNWTVKFGMAVNF